MKSKIFVFNDRKTAMLCRAIDSVIENRYYNIPPNEGALVDLTIPKGSCPFIKLWEEGVALVTYIDNTGLKEAIAGAVQAEVENG